MPYLAFWYRDFISASQSPVTTQKHILRNIIAENINTVFGIKHDFSGISSYKDFKDNVPVTDYSYYRNYIDAVCRNRDNILTSDNVNLMEPTSGTVSGTKLIPYTDKLQSEFKNGIYPWLYDLYKNHKALLGGTAYWSLSPVTDYSDNCSRPVGFQSDSQYLGLLGRVIERTMAVPSSVSAISDIKEWKIVTCLHLLSSSKLSLISVWNPQFFTILLNFIKYNKKALLHKLSNQYNNIKCSKKRIRELRILLNADSIDFQAVWPRLKLISCWADAYASLSVKTLKEFFPDIEIQPKGLISTEAFISFPLTGYRGGVLSVLSHFFEFRSLKTGEIYTADQLKQGHEYTVIVTTSGGLYRYNLGDTVKITGFFNKLPMLIFTGRTGLTLDFFGEKLSERFIARIIRSHILNNEDVRYASFVPCFKKDFHYRIYCNGMNKDTNRFEKTIDRALCCNYHYRHARAIGQIAPLRIIADNKDYNNLYIEYMRKKNKRLGDIKPVIISQDMHLWKFFEEEQ